MILTRYRVDPGGWSFNLYRYWFSIYRFGAKYAARDGVWLRVWLGKRKLLELRERR